jgi:hypothetical protein
MADAAPAADLEDMRREVECPVCLEACVDPRCLICLHTVCIECLKSMPVPLVCPQCRVTTPMPADGVEGLLKNFYIQKLVDVIAIAEAALQKAGSVDCTVRCSECGKLPFV